MVTVHGFAKLRDSMGVVGYAVAPLTMLEASIAACLLTYVRKDEPDLDAKVQITGGRVVIECAPYDAPRIEQIAKVCPILKMLSMKYEVTPWRGIPTIRGKRK